MHREYQSIAEVHCSL